MRAVFAFLLLPGGFGFAIPLLLASVLGWSNLNAYGLIPLAVGTAMLVWCVANFYVTGKGTLAPWSPPRHLVTNGLYRYSRNPMYVAVIIMLVGWAVLLRSSPHWGYAFIVAVAFHLRIVLAEEPWLARTHGNEYKEYRNRVRRWL